MPGVNMVEVLGREVRQGSPGELMVESSPSGQRRPPCKTNKGMSDEAEDAAALTYLPYLLTPSNLYVSYRSSCYFLWVGKCLSTRTREAK